MDHNRKNSTARNRKRSVAQTFLSAGKGDLPVASSTSGLLVLKACPIAAHDTVYPRPKFKMRNGDML